MEYKQFKFSVEAESTDQAFNNTQPTDKKLKAMLDKWLWAARFFKTRALARAAIEKGLVLYNGQTTTPNKEISLGDCVEIVSTKLKRNIVIKGVSTRRHNSEEANSLFEETSVSLQNRTKRTSRFLRRESVATPSK